MSRRALLGGAVALLAAGCGEDEEVVTPASGALQRELAAEWALAAATASLPEGAPRPAVHTVREISTRARDRAAKLARALAAEGGSPHDAPEQPAERVPAEEALARAKAAIVAHVVALPSLAGRELRALGAEMVTGAAADTALLSDALRMPVADPFPGTPE